MIRVQLIAEFEADDLGPFEVYVERFVLPDSFADNATGAHAKLLTILATADYVELPQRGVVVGVPCRTETVRSVAVWAG